MISIGKIGRVAFFFLLLFIWSNVFSQADTTKDNLSFDFGFTRGSNINVWPLLKYNKNSEKKELQILYPFYSSKTDYLKNTKHLQFIPFFIEDSSALGINRRYVSTYYPTLFHYEKQYFNNSHVNSFEFLELAPNISCFGLKTSPAGLYVENNLLFFIWYKKDITTQSTRLVVFPAYWYFSDKGVSKQLFLPFYYKRSGLNDNYLNVAGLYNHKRTNLECRNVVIPFYWSTKDFLKNDTLSKKTLFPIYWSEKSKVKNNKLILPLVYSINNENYKSLTIAPLLSYGHSPDNSKHHLSVTPLYWNVQSGNERTKVVAPFWISNEKYSFSDTVKFKTVLPLYWHYSSNIKRNNVLFPIYWNYKQYAATDTSSLNVLFPVYWRKKSASQTNLVLFPLVYNFNNLNYKSFTFAPLFSMGGKKDGKEKYFAITPLYWNFKTKEENKNYILPFVYTRKYLRGSDTVKRNIVFPLYWSYKDSKKSNKVLIPFLYSVNNQYYKSLTIAPFYSFGKSKYNTNSYFAISPLFWHVKSNHATTNVLFPLWLSSVEQHHYDTSRLKILFPVYWHYRSNMKKNDVVFPIYWHSKKYIYRDTINRTVVFPLYWSYKSNEKNNTTLFPLVYRLQDNSYTSFTFLPFFSVGHSPDYKTKHLDILQLYWNFKTSNATIKYIVPLWFSKEKYYGADTACLKTLFPLYWSYKSNIRNRNVLFPLFWNSTKYKYGDTIKRNVVFPVYWSTKSNEKNNYTLFPLLYKLNNDAYKSFSLVPLFSFGSNKITGNKYFAISPLYWHLEQYNETKDVFFPLYWKSKHYRYADTVRKSTLFPLYWSYSDENVNNKVLFPFLFSLKNENYRSFSIVPLFSFGKSYDLTRKQIAVTPLYWYNKSSEKKTSVLFPLWYSTERYLENDIEKSKTLFPLYWSRTNKDKNNKVVFPLVYSFRNDRNTSFTFAPLFSFGKSLKTSDKYMVVTPLYWNFKAQNGSTKLLFPLWLSTEKYNESDTLKTKMAFPLYWSFSHDGKKSDILLPFVYRFNNANYSSFTFFPLFSFGHSGNYDKSHLFITPLAGKYKRNGKTDAFVFPFYHIQKTSNEKEVSFLYFLYRKKTKPNYSRTSVLWPVCERVKEDNNRSFRFAPIVWRKKTDTSAMYSVQPFIYSFKSEARNTKILFWFLFAHETLKDSLTSNSFLWKFYMHDRYFNGDYETRLLYLLYANCNVNGQKEKSVLPFYRYTEQANGDKSKSVCLGFYNYFKQSIPEIHEFYEEERIFWFIRLRSNYDKLKSEGKEQYLKKK